AGIRTRPVPWGRVNSISACHSVKNAYFRRPSVRARRRSGIWTTARGGDRDRRPLRGRKRLDGSKGIASMSVSERLRAVVAQTFRMPIELVDDATRPGAVAAWDSLGQMDLVTALEHEFSTEFALEDIMLMNSVGEICS